MIDCKICKKQFKTITLTHLKNHQLTFDDYFLKFPDARTVSEGVSKKFSERAKKINAKRDYSGIGKKISLTKKAQNITPWNKGKTLSDETKNKISITRKQKYASGEIIHWNKGNNLSEETKQKISTANKGRKFTSEQHEKLCSKMKEIVLRDDYIHPMKGKKHSNETKLKLTQSLKKMWINKSAEIINNFMEKAAEENINIINIEDNYWFNFKCNNCNNKFSYSRQIFRESTKNGKDICPICNPRNKGVSDIERDFYNEIKKIWPTAEANNRTILGGKEIDVLIPEKKIGFEFTGLYWHSEKIYNEPKHLLWKQQYAFKNGIELISVFEDEWNNKKEIVLSRVKSILGITKNVIYGRKCIISEVSAIDSKTFLNNNHLQGSDLSTPIRLGLYFNSQLVMLTTFKKSSFVKGGTGTEWELSRMASKLDTNVVGGASKLISYFIQNYSNGFPLLTYVDRRWGSGNVYNKLNFEYIGETPPSYWYMLNYKTRIHRSSLMKHILIEMGGKQELTEWENAQNLGYDRIWDCGNLKYIYNKSNIE